MTVLGDVLSKRVAGAGGSGAPWAVETRISDLHVDRSRIAVSAHPPVMPSQHFLAGRLVRHPEQLPGLPGLVQRARRGPERRTGNHADIAEVELREERRRVVGTYRQRRW